MGLFPSVSQESMTSDVVATVHAIVFLLMQNFNIYRLNFHSWNFHVFALSLLLLLRVLVSHWLLRMRRRDDVGSQHWWIRLVVPISFLLNYFLLIERIRSISLWTSLTLGSHATLCFAPLPWNSDASLGVQLNARLRSLLLDGFNVFLLSSVYPMLFLRDANLYYDRARCIVFAFTCLLSCAAVGATRACISAYLPFSTKGGLLGRWRPKPDIKTSASGKLSSIKYAANHRFVCDSTSAVVFCITIIVMLLCARHQSSPVFQSLTFHFPPRLWNGEKHYVEGDLVMHRGRVHECATQSCSLEPESWLSVISCALFSQPLFVLNAAAVALASAAALLLYLVRLPLRFPSAPRLVHVPPQAFTSVSWTTCWVVVNLHYGIILWLLRQRPLVMPSLAAGLRS